MTTIDYGGDVGGGGLTGLPRDRRQRRRRRSIVPRQWLLLVIVGLCVQLLGNVIWYHQLAVEVSQQDEEHIEWLRRLSSELDVLQEEAVADQASTSTSSIALDDESMLFFTIRDSLRVAPTQLPPGFHIFDYMGGNATSSSSSSSSSILASSSQQQRRAGRPGRRRLQPTMKEREPHSIQELYYNAQYVDTAACSMYSVWCYRRKIEQVFQHLLDTHKNVSYLFYMEMDNELCVSLDHLRNLTHSYHPIYFLSTGIGFSGWIMSRQFVEDFMDIYAPARQRIWLRANSTTNDATTRSITQNNQNLSQVQQLLQYKEYSGRPEFKWNPDVVASLLLIEKQAWAVTQRYLVSHTILPSVGAGSLTVLESNPNGGDGDGDSSHKDPGMRGKSKGRKKSKHLPRCLEPRRAMWPISADDHRDIYGWDYFDYDSCPTAELFPCGPRQLPIDVIFDNTTIAREETKANIRSEHLDALVNRSNFHHHAQNRRFGSILVDALRNKTHARAILMERRNELFESEE
jgi:hypothetical protein